MNMLRLFGFEIVFMLRLFEKIFYGCCKHLRQTVQFNIRNCPTAVFNSGNGTATDIDGQCFQFVRAAAGSYASFFVKVSLYFQSDFCYRYQ